MNINKLVLKHRNGRAFRSAPNRGMRILKAGNVSPTISGLSLAALVWGSSVLGYALQPTDSPRNEDSSLDHVVTGTLDQLDFDSGKGLLKTDLGKPVFFDIVLPDLFRRLSIGQRVTIGINEQGQATKVMEIPPVELPPSKAH